MLFCSYETYSDHLDAVKSLARWFLRKWMEDHGMHVRAQPDGSATIEDARSKWRPCCLTAPKDAWFCSRCGFDLTSRRFSIRAFQDWILDVQGRTAENFEEVFGWDFQEDWTPWMSFRDVLSSSSVRVVEVLERADEVLTAAISPTDLPDWIPDWIRTAFVNRDASRIEDQTFTPLSQMLDSIVEFRLPGIPNEDTP